MPAKEGNGQPAIST